MPEELDQPTEAQEVEFDSETVVEEPPEPPQPSEPQAAEAKAEEPPKEPVKPEEVRARVMEELAKRYAVPQDFQPQAALPQYAARLYLDVFDAVMSAVMSQLPQTVTQLQAAQRAEEQFYQEFPALRDQKYRQSIIEAAKAVQASGEKLTPDQARERVGRMVMAMHGLNVRPGRPPIPAGPRAASAPAQPEPKNFWADLAVEE